MTASAVYRGFVDHRRQEPRPHAFRYRLCLAYLDLDELPRVFRGRWLWSAGRPNLAWFRRADYLGPRARPLREAVLDRVEQGLGRRPSGPVRVLTQLRTLGYLFNPVSFYLCFDREERLEALVAEITNTPWGERHAYVLDGESARAGSWVQWRFPKRFHVSPFFDMDQVYAWRLRVPGADEPTLEIGMTNLEGGRAVFHADLTLSRHPLDGRSLAACLLRQPLQTFAVHAAIYWQAALLRWKRMPFYPHPGERPSPTDERVARAPRP